MNKNSNKFIDTSVYSLEGNSIFDVSLKFERLALQELNRNPEFVYSGVSTNTAEQDGYDFKISMDKLISLVKEFYVKVVNRNQGLSDFNFTELENYLNDVIAEKLENQSQNDVKRFEKLMKTMEVAPGTEEDLEKLAKAIQSEIDNIKSNKGNKGPIDNYVRLLFIVDRAMKIFSGYRNDIFGVDDEDDLDYDPESELEFMSPEVEPNEEEPNEEEPNEEEILSILEDNEAVIKDIINFIIGKASKKTINEKINKLVGALKEGGLYDSSFDEIIELFRSKGKSQGSSEKWVSETKKELETAMQFILSNIANRLQRQDLGAGETKGEENEFQKLLAAAEGFQLDEVEDENEGGDEEEGDDDEAEEGEQELAGSGYVIRGGALGDNDYLQFIKDYNDYKSTLYQESINSLQQKPIFSKADAIYKSSRLQNYEGTASNVLRDIMITTGSMTTNIRNNRVNINQGITMDPKLVKSIEQDNDVIMNRYIPVLEEHPEVERNYKETFEKVLNNLKYINVFVNELSPK